MNVAVLCFHALGGSAVVAGELGRELATRGHRVHVVGAALPGRLDPPPPGVELHAVPLSAPPPVNGQGFALALAARLIDVVRREHIDVIHAHYASPHAAAASLARSALGGAAPPLVLTLHGSDVPPTGAPESQVMLIRDLVLQADAVTAPSSALASQARERLRLPAGLAVEVIPNFVDTARFQPGDGSALPALFSPRDWTSVRVLGHASNFRPVKRLADVIQVFARVREKCAAVLVLAGDGPERPRVEEEVRRLGLSQDVAFPGAVSDLAPLLRACDLFLLPSAHESFGLAALEAMSCGVPVLGSRVGGLPEVVGEDGGVLLPAGDVDAMATAALRLLSDDAARAALSRSARARAVRLFPIAPVLASWESLYRRLVSSTPEPS
ncbi:MAG TPA: N-acetyl-alpha-D-glucosaminyl L-malate synthase BshA [Myxococcales bacterium]|nr:N-acetyl-alpha-D-glucosaminyl L-malate synthase BshA [Myxococcales bacterium]